MIKARKAKIKSLKDLRRGLEEPKVGKNNLPKKEV
jgi:hypothetical protein